MAKKIVTPRGCGKRIAELLGCSTVQVSYALNFKDDSPLSLKIRKLAINDFNGRVAEWGN